MYTEIDHDHHVECQIRSSRFVEAVQKRLAGQNVTITAPHQGEDVAVYVTVNALRMPSSALTGGCIASINLLVHRPVKVHLPGSAVAINAKAVLCNKSAVVAPDARQNPEPELLARAAEFAGQCVAEIREKASEPTGRNAQPSRP